jgi:hypothetical protein
VLLLAAGARPVMASLGVGRRALPYLLMVVVVMSRSRCLMGSVSKGRLGSLLVVPGVVFLGILVRTNPCTCRCTSC